MSKRSQIIHVNDDLGFSCDDENDTMFPCASTNDGTI